MRRVEEPTVERKNVEIADTTSETEIFNHLINQEIIIIISTMIIESSSSGY